MPDVERLCFEDWPDGPISLVVRGDAGAVQLYYPSRPATLHFHRPKPGPGEASDCPLLPGGKCWEEINLAAVLAAEVAAAGQNWEAVAYERLEELYERLAEEAAIAAARLEVHGE